MPDIAGLIIEISLQVFESLKMDLKDENIKEYFVSYQGTSVVMQFVRPSHKQGLLSFAVEILGLMSLDSLSLPGLEIVIQENDFIISLVMRVVDV